MGGGDQIGSTGPVRPGKSEHVHEAGKLGGASDVEQQVRTRNAALIMTFFDSIAAVDHRIHAAHDAIAHGAFVVDSEALADLQDAQQKNNREVQQGLAQAREDIANIQENWELWEEVLYNLPPDLRKKAVAQTRSEFLAKFNEIAAAAGKDAHILPHEDEARIQPMPEGPSIGVPPKGPSGPGSAVMPQFPLSDRQRQLLQMLKELIERLDEMADGPVPATGYPLGQIVVEHCMLVVEDREIKAIQLADMQEALNDTLSSFNRLLQGLRLIQNSAREGGIPDSGEAERLANTLRQSMIELVGVDWHFNMLGEIVPGEGSQLDVLMKSLHAAGHDYRTNPVYSMLNTFLGSINGEPPVPDKDTVYKFPPTVNLLQALTWKPSTGPKDPNAEPRYDNTVAWVQMMAFNYDVELNERKGPDNKPINSGTPYVTQVSEEFKALQGAATGLAGQFSVQMQQLLTEVTQMVDTSGAIADNYISSMDSILSSTRQQG